MIFSTRTRRTSALHVALAVAFSSFAAFGPTAAHAKSSPFDNAANLYLGEKYDEAFSAAEALVKSEPKNYKARYLLVQCYMRSHNHEKGEEELRFLEKNSTDPLVTSLAKVGLKRIEAKRAKVPTFDMYPRPRVAEKHEPVKKVYWFYTNWCQSCKRFTPGYNLALKRFSDQITFEKYNAEDPKNWPLTAKFEVIGYPTLVYFDAKGSIIENYPGAPLGETFSRHLVELGANPPKLTY